MGNSASPAAVLVADTHFHLEPDAAERVRLDRFLEFLARCRGVPDLVLLGDIFDFWFDYPHFRLKGYDSLLQALDRVRDAGTRIHFVGGNHDIWAAAYLHERYGSDPAGGPLDMEWDGLRVRLVHGDGLLVRDWIYNAFRWIVRRRLGVVLAKSLHPELLYAFSTWLSGTSRGVARDEGEKIEARAAERLARATGDWDLMVMGHVHHPFVATRDGRRLAALGGWLDREGYGVIRAGDFALRDFATDGYPD